MGYSHCSFKKLCHRIDDSLQILPKKPHAKSKSELMLDIKEWLEHSTLDEIDNASEESGGSRPIQFWTHDTGEGAIKIHVLTCWGKTLQLIRKS
jgi:hypothetical protein